MIYSVYNYDTHAYDYYEGRGAGGTHAGSPRIRKPTSDLGASPEQAAWVLPPGSRKVGSGALPQGSIASLSGAEPESSSMPGPLELGIYAAIVYTIWRTIR